MKLKSLVLSFVLIAVVNSTFATIGGDENSAVSKNFQKEFSMAENVNWSVTGNMRKATFTMNGQEWYAYYSEAGQRLALARNISVTNLPINLLNEVRSDYKGYWITEAFEMSKDENDTAFYVAVENADKKVVLKSLNLSEWTVIKSTNKN
jgi:hypothetical protein